MTLDADTKYTYEFYLDVKWGWVVRDPHGADYVMNRDAWLKLFCAEELEDRYYFLTTYLETTFYGSIRTEIEITVKDGYITRVNLCAPDGNILKEDITVFKTMVKPFI